MCNERNKVIDDQAKLISERNRTISDLDNERVNSSREIQSIRDEIYVLKLESAEYKASWAYKIWKYYKRY